jgi:hypothetical protein
MAHGLIKSVFNWAIDEDRCETNPAIFRKMFDDTPVRRVGKLNDERVFTMRFWFPIRLRVASHRFKLPATIWRRRLGTERKRLGMRANRKLRPHGRCSQR